MPRKHEIVARAVGMVDRRPMAYAFTSSLAALTLPLVLVSAGCGSAGLRQRYDAPAAKVGDRLTASEIASTRAITAYDAVVRLRPRYLQPRGFTSVQPFETAPVTVYLDGARWDGAEVLRTVRASDVVEIEHLSATAATTRYGLGHLGGVLVVKTGHP
jgi:hypothetical protein